MVNVVLVQMLCNEVWTMLPIEGIMMRRKRMKKLILEVDCLWKMRGERDLGFLLWLPGLMIHWIVEGKNKERRASFRRSMSSGLGNDFEAPVLHLDVWSKKVDFCFELGVHSMRSQPEMEMWDM